MMYLSTQDMKLQLFVLETENLDKLRQGKPIVQANPHGGDFVIGWTPDFPWLREQFTASGGDVVRALEALEASAKRPEAPRRGVHEPEVIRFRGGQAESEAGPRIYGELYAMARKLKSELTLAGYGGTPDQFRDNLSKYFDGFNCDGAWTPDRLVCNPTTAARFCTGFRENLGTAVMSDELILRTLLNLRKSH